MPEALLRPYDPATVEPGIYATWEASGAFRAEVDPDREPYSIAMPPPNLTGALHYGHVAFVTFQDLMIRWQRMRGVPALWLPGTDHAAIATNAVLVNQLAGEGKSREDIGRPAFEEMFWDWMRQSGQRIRSQLRMAGASCDWSRERFTMDPGLSRAVNAAFVQLYEKGLIYRGSYLVNWDPVDQTAISDIEVEYQEVDGWLWTVRYPLAEGGHLEVATTRPETILGDTAIAVNPGDERYRELIGKQALVPVLGRSIPIVADDYVDPDFGSGAVKVTPGHDPNDYAIGQRHDLPMINILELDGRLNDNAGPFAGQTREAARANLLDRLESDGLLAGRSPTATPSVTASARERLSSQCSLSSGSWTPPRWPPRPPPRSARGKSSSTRRDSRRCSCTGWTTSAIGAFHARSGSGTGSRSGTANRARTR